MKNNIHFLSADVDDAGFQTAVLQITQAAFMIDPQSGERIKGDTPTEVPLVEALFQRQALAHLHLAFNDDGVVGYVLYTAGSVTNNPGLAAQGLTIMGVAPQHQRQKVGLQLLRWSVLQMKDACEILFVLGHPAFYPLAGFVKASSLQLSFSFPAPDEAGMALLFEPRLLNPGVISYHPIVHEFV